MFAVSLLALELDGFGAVEDDCDVAPPEADFFSGSVGVEDDELDAPEDGVLGGVAEDEELDEPDGGVALPPTDAEPEALPDGELGVVVDEDEDAVSRGADGEVEEVDEEVR